jgi:Holliday junction resolvase RusA-like endonuclease
MKPIEITIYGAPVGKARPRIYTRNGRAMAYTPKPTADYERTIKGAAREAMGTTTPYNGAVSVSIHAWYAIPSSWSKIRQSMAAIGAIAPCVKPDVDNVAKTVLDALNGVVYADDSQVVALDMSKTYSKSPYIRIVVTPVTSAHGSVPGAS